MITGLFGRTKAGELRVQDHTRLYSKFEVSLVCRSLCLSRETKASQRCSRILGPRSVILALRRSKSLRPVWICLQNTKARDVAQRQSTCHHLPTRATQMAQVTPCHCPSKVCFLVAYLAPRSQVCTATCSFCGVRVGPRVLCTVGKLSTNGATSSVSTSPALNTLKNYCCG